MRNICALSIMTKAPSAGKVKTRLIPPLTAEEAAALNTCFLRDTAASISAVAKKTCATGVGVYTPRDAKDAYTGVLPDHFDLLPQRGETLDDRLIHAVEDILQIGFASVCLINSDSPTLPRNTIADAVRILSKPGDRVVLGPSDDGGYYLVGLKQLHRNLFAEIDWSTRLVLNQTLQRAAEIGLETHLLQTWFDVDDRMTLSRLCDELIGSNMIEQKAPATQHFLAEIIAREGRERIWPSGGR